jgi:hypothetical protein
MPLRSFVCSVLALTIVVLVALLSGLANACLAYLDGDSIPRVARAGGATFGTALLIGLAVLTVVKAGS